MTKRRFKFQVILVVEELNAVPFVTDILFCKVRLRNGGTYSASTSRQNVNNHSVLWHKRFEFSCKMFANSNTGILDPCIARLSVRKEMRGGRSANKIGFVDLNLAEFADACQRKRHCLLEGYNDKIRLNNSILKVMVSLQLLSGDPLFKLPTVQRDATLGLAGEPSDVHPFLPDSVSSGSGSLPRKNQFKGVDEPDSFHVGHARNLSSISQFSKRSDYTSHLSRTPSNSSHISGSNDVKARDGTLLPTGLSKASKSPASGKNVLIGGSPFHTKAIDVSQSRMGDTRVDADDIVSRLIDSQDFSQNTTGTDCDNLQLYVAVDGSTTLGGQNLNNRIGSGVYHPVIFETNISQHLKNKR